MRIISANELGDGSVELHKSVRSLYVDRAIFGFFLVRSMSGATLQSQCGLTATAWKRHASVTRATIDLHPMAHEAAPLFVQRQREQGSITLLALCMTAAMAIALGTYVALCARSAQFAARLVNREKAQQLAQAGLEDALWALNQNSWSSAGPNGTGVWATSGVNRTLTLTYTLPDSGTGQVVLTVANYASTGPTWPSITCTATVALQGGQTYTKSLQASTGPAPLFGNAIASAKSYVSFESGGSVDSWNSNPDNDASTAMVAYSFTAGNSANYNAVVAGKGNGTNGVILNQATVCGYVSSFGLPVSYSITGSPPAKVLGPTTASGVDWSRVGKSAFVPVSDVFSVTEPTVNVSNFTLITLVLNLLGGVLNLPAAVDSCKINGNLKIDPHVLINPNPNITINKPIKMIVDGDFTIMGSGVLTITATGSLELYVTGDVSIGGNGILNQTNDPKKLAIYCTSSSTTDAVEYTTANSFCGVIYSENKPIDIRQNATFYGALLSRQYVRFSTNATAPVFHYDLALRQTRFSGVATPYLITTLTEL
jgi:hypothetical protein